MNKQQEKELLKVNVDRELPKERMIEMFRHDLIVTALKLLKQAEQKGIESVKLEVKKHNGRYFQYKPNLTDDELEEECIREGFNQAIPILEVKKKKLIERIK